ncbi:hypothetical protein PHMEG_00039155 [Phytophthora megakarya]|uniref:Uncharacterized protein n=1 Tax=Phytophthora megakarya TaxID=4795 RepID=A0A225UGD1_9STRA|nr:hypothetical protein PHMEG_00039155 [Phytophthora megakarya]
MGINNSVVAHTTTTLTFTERTLHNVFTRLFNTRSEWLLTKLLDQRIVVHGSTRFCWNGSCGRITSISTHADLLTPMLHLVENLEDVSRMFEKAYVTPDFQWKST